MRAWKLGDPVDWAQTCEMGCHVEFDQTDATFGPAKRHERAGTKPCEMAQVLRNGYARRWLRRKG